MTALHLVPQLAPHAAPAYVVVTPVRDEAQYIAATLASMLAQSHPPLRWVIVDDGSTDDTLRIVQAHTRDVPWVTVVSTGSAQRRLGSAEVLAFQRGVAEIDAATPYAYIAKLDGDVRLPFDYFERLLLAMAAEPGWGIASGVYCELQSRQWQPVPMPPYHAAGASKVVQRQCFEQIGGFVASKGWDTVDEIRAGQLGWRTGHIAAIQFQHLKPEGQAMGTLQTHRFHGDIYYQTGGGFLFLLAKVLHRMVAAKPRPLSGLAMLWGYAAPCLQRRPRLVDRAEARFYRGMLNRRIATSVAKPVARLLAMVRT